MNMKPMERAIQAIQLQLDEVLTQIESEKLRLTACKTKEEFDKIASYIVYLGGRRDGLKDCLDIANVWN